MAVLFVKLLVFSLSVDRFLPRSRCFDDDSSVSGFPIDVRALFLSCFLLVYIESDIWTMYISVIKVMERRVARIEKKEK
jgi:hypothetical protein